MDGKEAQFAEVVKLFGLVLNQYRLYSNRHPAAQLAIRNFFARLDPVLLSESTLTLGFVEGRLIMNGHPLDNKKSGVGDLHREFHRLQIESLAFEQGVTEEEIGIFFKMLAIPARILEEKGGFKKAFEEAGFQHIRLENARYRMIKEAEEVVATLESGAEGAAPEHVRKIERMEEVIEYYLTGSQEAVTYDTARLGYEVERRPRAVAEEIVRRAINLELLKRIVEGVESFLKECLAPLYIQEGKDFSQPIYTLAMELKKTLKEVGIKGAGDLVFVLERCADTVKVELMVRAFKGGDQKTLQKMARLSRKGAREKLKERLVDLGVEGGVLDRLFSERGTLPRSRKVDVTPEELEELRRIRDQFEEELSRRVTEKTALLEREKKHALDEKERVDQIIRNVGEALHELRAPLVSIEQSLGALLRREIGEISPEQEKFLSMAQRNVSQLSRAVNDVLDIANLEAKKLEHHPTALSPPGS